MNNFYRNNKLACVIAIIILLSAIILGVGYQIYDLNNQNLSEVKKCVIIDNEEQLNYEMKTNDGFKVAVNGEGKTEEDVFFEFMHPTNDYIYMSYTKYRYTKHTRRVKNSNGTYRTEVYYTWDSIGGDSKQSKTINMLGNELSLSETKFMSIHSLKINDKMFAYGKESLGYWYPRTIGNFVGNIRYSFDVMDNNKMYTFAGNIKQDGFSRISEKTPKYIIVGEKSDIVDSLKLSGKLIILITLLITFIVDGFVYYKLYLKD